MKKYPIALKHNSVIDQIGTEAYFNAFFATIHGNLEGDDEWGSKYPALLKELHSGKLSGARGAAALEELNDIEVKFKALSPTDVVWEYDGEVAEPPWGSKVRSDVTDLSNFFITSTGRDVVKTLRETFEYMQKKGGDMFAIEMKPGNVFTKTSDHIGKNS